MFTRMPRGLRFSARLVLDLREWYVMYFGGGFQGKLSVDGSEKTVRAIVRPKGAVSIVARPAATPSPGANFRWPFGGEMELITKRTPSGLLAFYGRVRSSREAPMRRILLEGTECDLEITAAGFLPIHLTNVKIPSSIDAPLLIEKELVPGPNYSFPSADTLLRGSVLKANGSGEAGVNVTAVDLAGQPIGKLKPAQTDELGQWVLLLKQEGETEPIPSPARLKFEKPSGTELVTHHVNFAKNRTNLMPQTLLRGFIVRADGEVVSEAKITVNAQPGETHSGPDGSWVFAFGVAEPLSGNVNLTIQVAIGEQPPVTQPAAIVLGQTNRVPNITV